jgi:hypothetical protein
MNVDYDKVSYGNKNNLVHKSKITFYFYNKNNILLIA